MQVGRKTSVSVSGFLWAIQAAKMTVMQTLEELQLSSCSNSRHKFCEEDWCFLNNFLTLSEATQGGLRSSISGRLLKPEVTSESKKNITIFSKLVNTRMKLNARSTNTNCAISVQGLSWVWLASDSAFQRVRGKFFHNIGLKRASFTGFIWWQSHFFTLVLDNPKSIVLYTTSFRKYIYCLSSFS